MSKRGPDKTPVATNKLRGDLGKHGKPSGGRVNPPDGMVDCPDWFDEVAQAEWKRITPILAKMRILKQTDMAQLAVYCEAWGEFMLCTAAIEEEGMTHTTANGNIIQHPLVGIKNKATERINRLAAKFGLDPSSWSTMEVPEQPPESEKSKYFEK